MTSAKDLRVQSIARADADRIIKALHYSGKVTRNAQVHLGVFLDGRCGGAMQFGPPIDKHRSRGLVSDTPWNGFLELARLAFAEWLPRNSESRALGYAMRWLRATYPWVQWVQSFADATQSGDGTIYRASGFVLTAIKPNRQMLRMPDGAIVAKKTMDDPNHTGPGGRYGSGFARENGATWLPGFQLRYIYFLDPTARARLTVPILPFDEIDRRGAGMYRGHPRASRLESEAPDLQSGDEGAAMRPTRSTLLAVS